LIIIIESFPFHSFVLLVLELLAWGRGGWGATNATRFGLLYIYEIVQTLTLARGAPGKVEKVGDSGSGRSEMALLGHKQKQTQSTQS